MADFQTCSLVSTGFSATNVAYGFALAKGSPYRKLFNYHLNAMMEDGEMQRIKGRYGKVLDESQHVRPCKIMSLIFARSKVLAYRQTLSRVQG